MNKIVIANMYRGKDKISFFAIHQIVSKIKAYKPEIPIEFHILWDGKLEGTPDGIDWGGKIDTFLQANGVKMFSYNRDFFNGYCRTLYHCTSEVIKKMDNLAGIYTVLLGHYLRRVNCESYCLIYDDDILINYDFRDIIDYMLDNVPVLISEPMNANCDKGLLTNMLNRYGKDLFRVYEARNPMHLGFNGGIQGIDLEIYDEYLSPRPFWNLLLMFDFGGIYDKDGKEIWGGRRHFLDTQQQSFFGIMNLVKPRKTPVILNPDECYVIPNWGDHPTLGHLDDKDENDGWTMALKSKITHFIGHTQGHGKPKVFHKKVDEYLTSIT